MRSSDAAPTALDRYFRRVFGDDEPSNLGSGWVGGVGSVLGVALGLFVVLCLHFPRLLTAPVLRAYYPVALLRGVLATPRFHHFHHAAEAEAIDKNFAVHLPILDRIFGTHFLPERRWPQGYGVSNARVARTYLAQILDPFRASSRSSSPETGSVR